MSVLNKTVYQNVIKQKCVYIKPILEICNHIVRYAFIQNVLQFATSFFQYLFYIRYRNDHYKSSVNESKKFLTVLLLKNDIREEIAIVYLLEDVVVCINYRSVSVVSIY